MEIGNQQSKLEVPLLLSLEEGDFTAECLLKKIGFKNSRLTKGILTFFLNIWII